MSANVQFAHNPELSGTCSVQRPLSARETMNRAKAITARSATAQSPACIGQIFIGMFFDGTGNNRDNDYVSVENSPQKHKHSNVVRLYHAYPNDKTRGTARYYSFYIPGVGTPFRAIGKSGGRLGTGFLWSGEPRLSRSLSEHHLFPYDDNKGFCTIGGGHLIDGKRSCAVLKSNGSASYKKFEKGISIARENELFANDIEIIVNRALKSIRVPLHQYEFDALMSLAFNAGGLTKFEKLLGNLNQGDYEGCCREFRDITNGGDKALVTRRIAEMKMFRNNIYDPRH